MELSNTVRPNGISKTWKDRSGATFDFRAAWRYQNLEGEPVGMVARFENADGKQVIPFFKAGDNGKFKAGGPPIPVLYGAERLNGHKSTALIVEGEKAAAAIHSLGLLALSSQGGVSNAARGAWEWLVGVPKVICLPDNDTPGEKYCQDATKAIAACKTPDNTLPELRVLRIPGLPAHGDICDWIADRVPEWNQLEPIPSEQRESLRAELLALLDTAQPVPDDWLKPTESPSWLRRKDGQEENPEENSDSPKGNSYVELPNGTGITWVYWDKRAGDFCEELLCNFTARIVEELAKDDGVDDPALAMRLVGCLNGRELPPIDMNWEQFIGMAWAAKQWASSCVIEPGSGIKDALRAAIQTISNTRGFVERRTVYTHTGWRCIGGNWVYLHGGGALGAQGTVAGIETELCDLARYTLPEPSKTAQERLEAAQASSRYLCLAALEITLPLLSVTFLAPFAQALNADFMLWLEAPSQSQKSSIAAVALAHYGAAIDRTSLTANWTATANSIEGTLFTLADSLAVIDDYAPQTSSTEQAKLDATASRVIRGCGNRQGRGRLKADLTRQTERYPRGLVISTAEQWIQGESLIARLFGISLRRGDVDLPTLSAMQMNARNGLLARCMTDFLQSVAGQREQVIADCKELWEGFRQKALEAGLTGRAPEQVAFLLTGAKLAANHYRTCGVEVDTANWVETLFSLARRHETQVLESQPADRFRAALQEILAAGGAYLEGIDSDGGRVHSQIVQRGKQVGWVNESKQEVYLLAAPALELVNESLRKGDSTLNIKPAALWRQCRQRGWLLHGDSLPGGGERSSRTCWIDGKPTKALVFSQPKLLETD